jgi:CRP-like cAMP-binding protein
MIDVATIRRVPLFRDFADDEAAAIVATVTDRRYGKHQFIVREGDPGDTFFILVRG